MPKMVKLAAAKDFKPKTEDEKTAYAAAKAKKLLEVDYVTAMENIANSGGMYALVKEGTVQEALAPRRLEDMTNDELKLAMASFGIQTEKKMKRGDVISLIRSRMMEVDIEDGESDE